MTPVSVGPSQPPVSASPASTPAFGARSSAYQGVTSSTSPSVSQDTLTVKFGKKKDKVKKNPGKHLSSSVSTAGKKIGTVGSSLTATETNIDTAITQLNGMKNWSDFNDPSHTKNNLEQIITSLNAAKNSTGSLKTALEETEGALKTSTKATKYVKKELKDGANEFKKKKMGFFSKMIWLPFRMLASVAGFFKGGQRTMINILAKKG